MPHSRNTLFGPTHTPYPCREVMSAWSQICHLGTLLARFWFSLTRLTYRNARSNATHARTHVHVDERRERHSPLTRTAVCRVLIAYSLPCLSLLPQPSSAIPSCSIRYPIFSSYSFPLFFFSSIPSPSTDWPLQLDSTYLLTSPTRRHFSNP